MEECFNGDLKSFLDRVGNRWVISPNQEIFDEPNDPVVERNIKDCEIEARERENEKVKTEEKIDAGVDEAIEEIKKKGNGCFSLHSKVILANGKRIEVSQLSIGDKVCCGEKDGKLIFSEIYAIVHADDQTVTQYQRIDYLKKDGTEGTLRLTPKHHLFISQGKTIFAEDVRAHVTELLLFDGKKLIPVIPHRVAKEWELGYIAPFTQNGKIVVDEILCSCYAVAPPYQEIINFAMIPIHWFLEQLDYYNAIIKKSY
ncbi:hint module-domain-containing protein [Glomus cerebriforme]|uniref:Hint module-domain-containing protein n=1 Tax=Glomus cerebriforme TaxID=658196 RepID=A0A397S9T7_9GLOM|nr:hint module-domain-containing protein [Glomus cerebriforme]